MPEPDAVLLDLYDTLVWSDWWGWQERLAGELGVTHEDVGSAFDLTRPARSTAPTPTPTRISPRWSGRSGSSRTPR